LCRATEMFPPWKMLGYLVNTDCEGLSIVPNMELREILHRRNVYRGLSRHARSPNSIEPIKRSLKISCLLRAPARTTYHVPRTTYHVPRITHHSPLQRGPSPGRPIRLEVPPGLVLPPSGPPNPCNSFLDPRAGTGRTRSLAGIHRSRAHRSHRHRATRRWCR
jgi:hypothetical protein